MDRLARRVRFLLPGTGPAPVAPADARQAQRPPDSCGANIRRVDPCRRGVHPDLRANGEEPAEKDHQHEENRRRPAQVNHTHAQEGGQGKKHREHLAGAVFAHELGEQQSADGLKGHRNSGEIRGWHERTLPNVLWLC